MTNLEYMIASLTDQFDDGGASYEATLYYNVACPYFAGDRRCHCYPEEYRNGTAETVKFKDIKDPDRDLCVACKHEWLNSEVDE